MAKGIYCYVDKENDKIVYVGKDSNIDKNRRHRDHLAPSTYNAQPINRILQNNPDRYKYCALWEIDDCTDNHLNQMEIFYIKKYAPQFNFTEGGDGISGFTHSEETRKKISESMKGENHPMCGKTLSEETRKKMSEAQQGKTLSEKTRKKISEANKGENNSMYGKKGENHPMYGKRHSEETRKKISEARNTTGFYRVTKVKQEKYKKGFSWLYRYFNENNEQKSLSSTDLKKLEQKVLLNNLEWKIINEEYAKQSLREDKI